LASDDPSSEPRAEWWKKVLLGSEPEFVSGSAVTRAIRLVDLFSASGGFTLGFKMAAAALGMEVHINFAADTDRDALAVYRRNHLPEVTSSRSVADFVDSQLVMKDDRWTFFYDPEICDDELQPFVGQTDVLIGGPPCQGHSNLNNHTRRDDGRNALYPQAVAIGVALGCEAILIENVQAVLRDSHESVPKSRDVLESLDWSVSDGVLKAHEIGWPQTRKRHFLAALRNKPVMDIEQIGATMSRDALPLSWAIDDLLDRDDDSVLDVVGNLSRENIDRIDYLFDHDAYTLPNAERPLRHRDGHTYPSSYGRLKWDEPSGTITTGFLTPGRGRFVHPLRRRPLTPHEAARIQGFPDSYQFHDSISGVSKASLAKWIGDAVPSPLGYAAAFSVLSSFV
jgi:DNA (cytosine-5)-methyltransferase 1